MVADAEIRAPEGLNSKARRDAARAAETMRSSSPWLQPPPDCRVSAAAAAAASDSASLGFERGGQKRKAAVVCVLLASDLGSAELGSNFFLEGIEVGSFGATR